MKAVNNIGALSRVSGGIMAGPLTLWRDPAKPLEAATKQYVDDVSGSTRTRYEVYSSYESLPQDP